MSERKQRIFISYRREDCAAHAGRLAENLEHQLDADVFLDVDAIPPGADFVDFLEREVGACDVMMVMIGDDWLETRDHAGESRLADPLDFVHIEIRSALERGVPVIPVLVEGMRMPRQHELPEGLALLARRQAVQLRDDTWRQDVQTLVTRMPGKRALSDQAADPASKPALSPQAPPVAAPASPPPRKRQSTPIDFNLARAFIESIPAGQWTSYKDVAVAGGSPKAAMAVGEWLRTKGEEIANVYRVLNSRGEVSNGWAPADPALPPTPEAVRALLREEGIVFDYRERADPEQRWEASGPGSARGRAPRLSTDDADTVIVAARHAKYDYERHGAYICQPGRSFRDDLRYIGFYSEKEIAPVFPAIVERRLVVPFTIEEVERLRESADERDAAVAKIVSGELERRGTRRTEGEAYQVFLLDEEAGFRLDAPIQHEASSAWVQSQRYASSEALQRGPATTRDLAGGR